VVRASNDDRCIAAVQCGYCSSGGRPSMVDERPNEGKRRATIGSDRCTFGAIQVEQNPKLSTLCALLSRSHSKDMYKERRFHFFSSKIRSRARSSLMAHTSTIKRRSRCSPSPAAAIRAPSITIGSVVGATAERCLLLLLRLAERKIAPSRNSARPPTAAAAAAAGTRSRFPSPLRLFCCNSAQEKMKKTIVFSIVSR